MGPPGTVLSVGRTVHSQIFSLCGVEQPLLLEIQRVWYGSHGYPPYFQPW